MFTKRNFIILTFNKGFSLVELLVVIAIIAILASAGFVIFNKYIDNTKIVGTKSTYNQHAKQINIEYEAISGNLSINSVYKNEEAGLFVNGFTTCGEYINTVKQYFKRLNKTNSFDSNEDLVICGDADIQTDSLELDACSCPDESGGYDCLDDGTQLPLGSILLVCLNGENKSFNDGFGLQVILNNRD